MFNFIDKNVHSEAVQLAAENMGVSYEEFIQMFVNRMLSDDTVSESLKDEIRKKLID